MQNELLVLDDLVVVQPGKLEIQNQTGLDGLIKEITVKYDGQIVTEDTLKEAKSSRAELRKYAKVLDKKRLEKKREYMVPADNFEKDVKNYVKKLNGVALKIDEGIKYFEARQEAERKSQVKAMIEEAASIKGVDPETIVIQKGWLTKSMSKAKKMEEIVEAVERQARINKDLEETRKYCLKLGLPSERYEEIARDQGYWEARNFIDGDYESLQKKKEIELLAKEAEIELQRMNTVEVGTKRVDKTTGEVVKEFQIVAFKLKGTKEQLDDLARYVKETGIEVITASARENVLERGA